MIPNELLREAAARTCESYVSGLLSGYDPGYRHAFSPGFERKIARLKRRAEHPALYRTVRRAAIILLAILFAGTVWVAADAEARAAFFGWIGEITGSYLAYHYEGTADEAAEPLDHRPVWIPEGYAEASVRVFDNETTVRYLNGEGTLLRFSYVTADSDVDWFFNISQGHTEDCLVGEYAATLFVSEADDVAGGLTWADRRGTVFHISGFVSGADLIRMAESVRAVP